MLNPAILTAMLVAGAVTFAMLVHAIIDGLAAYFDSINGEDL